MSGDNLTPGEITIPPSAVRMTVYGPVNDGYALGFGADPVIPS